MRAHEERPAIIPPASGVSIDIPPSQQLLPLTSLRFGAALLVFIWHCPATRAMGTAFSFPYAGVAFFFILSGFILTLSYHRLFASHISCDGLRRFYGSRFARLYPLHVCSLAIALGVQLLFGAPIAVPAFVASLPLLQSWFASAAIHYGGNGPAWSLSVEIFFYALFPLIAFLVIPLLRTARDALIAAAVLWLSMLAVLAPVTAAMGQWDLYAFAPARLPDFLIGVFIATAFLRSTPAPRTLSAGTMIELLCIGAALLSAIVSVALPTSLRFSVAFSPACAALIFTMARQEGRLSRALAHPVFVHLGELSFSFYLLHVSIIFAFEHVHVAMLPPIAFIMLLCVSLACSFAVFHTVEQPARRRIRALFGV